MIEGVKILIVDDDVFFVDRLVLQLKRERLIISWLLSSRDTMQRIADIMPDVVVLNINVCGPDPLEILCQIKRHYPLLEVILLTDSAGMDDAISGLKRGAVDYLKKPVNMEELIVKIKAAFQKKLKQHEKIGRFKRFLMKES